MVLLGLFVSFRKLSLISFHVKRLVFQNDKLQKRCDLQPQLFVSQATSSSMIMSKQELKIRGKKKPVRSEKSNFLKSNKRTEGKLLTSS